MIDRYPRSHLVPDESGGLGRRTCMWLALMPSGTSGNEATRPYLTAAARGERAI